MKKLFTTLIFSALSFGLFAQLEGINLALGKPASASSNQQPASNAVDGNYGTRWESASTDNEWITIDLQSRYVIDTVLIFWEAVVTSANPGVIQGSFDGNYWWDMIQFGATDEDKTDTLLVNDTTRFVKMKGIHRNGPYGYSPWEIEVYGTEEITSIYVDSLSVSPDDSDVEFGQALQLTVAGFDQNGDPFDLAGATWTVSNGGMISQSGLFTANKIGDFKVTVVSGRVSDTALIRVTSSSPVPTSIVLTPERDTLTENETLQFSATVLDQDGNPMDAMVEWETKFNTVDETGMFTASFTGDHLVVAAVNYSFDAVSGSISDSAVVSVYPISTENIALSYESVGAASQAQPAANGVDNNTGSRWEVSADNPDMSWVVKLDTVYDLGAVVIDWETAGARSYEIQVSNDSVLWERIYICNPNDTVRPTPNHSIDSLPVYGNARFVRFNGLSRSFAPYGPSFYELKIYPAANSTVAATSIVVSPKTATIDEGEELTLSYAAFSASGDQVDVEAEWSVLSTDGAITAGGVFSSVRSGEYQVVVSFGNLADTAIITVEDVSVVTSIVVSPDDASITEGETQQFAAVAYDQFGLEIDFTPAWSVTGGGTIDVNGLFSATDFGNYYVIAASSLVADSVTIAIADLPELDSIAVSPIDTSVVEGQTIQFIATGFDQFGNLFPITASWLVTGGGSIDANGLLTTSTVGTFYVKAENNGIVDSVMFTVTETPVLDSISVTPKVNNLGLNQSRQFTANGFDQFGNSFAFDAAWSVTGGGTISENGLFTATDTGSYYVIALNGNIKDSVLVDIEAILVLDSIAVSPESASITEGETQQFAATGYDQYGDEFELVPEWSVSGGGSVNTSGLFTATSAGSYYVKAFSGEIADSVVIEVLPLLVLDSIAVAPETASIMVGLTQQYSAAGFDQFGDAFAFSPAWSVSGGGSINNDGLFTASAAGTFYVKASAGTISDSVAITITEVPVLETLVVTPETATINVGETQQFSVTGTDQFASPIEVSVTWSVSGGGTISETGLFTANAKGTFTITAAQGDVSATASVTVVGESSVDKNTAELINIYPNPATDFITIDLGGLSFSELEIISINGTRVYYSGISSVADNIKVDFTTFKPGLYFIRLINSADVFNFTVTKQ
ncbi:MAG: Ig-like domain-containing protein [Bacteroidales bacterium]|nr:Ig-like domain-containing protein [Bacteroidales bacterium]